MKNIRCFFSSETVRKTVLKYSKTMTIHNIKNPKSLPLAVEMLKAGGVVALPTDTIYGIACSATNVNGIHRLYDIKQRDENKPVAICVGKSSDIPKWAQVDHLPHGLLDLLLPGPVTLVLSSTKELNPLLLSGSKVGIRVPNCPFILNVVNLLKSPIALTSANLSGEPSSVCVGEFRKLWVHLSGVFDGGTIGQNKSGSTVVDLSEHGYYSIIREGIAGDATCAILKSFGILPKY